MNRCERGSTAGGELPIGEAVRILREVRGRPALLRKNAIDPSGKHDDALPEGILVELTHLVRLEVLPLTPRQAGA